MPSHATTRDRRQPLIDVRALCVEPLGKAILDHCDLDVVQGELLAIVGANGAGKSSLLRCLAGVWAPSSGTIRIGGFDRGSDDLAIRRFTAYLPSEPELLGASVRENVRLFAESYGVDPEVAAERRDALLRMFDLKEHQDTAVPTLSKGQQKKAALACAFVTGARLYLLDEPFTGGIDPRGHLALKRLLAQLASDEDVTVVYATQILELAEELAHRIAIVDGGRVLACGTLAELRAAQELDAEAPLEAVFAELASRDTARPVAQYMQTLAAASRAS